MARLVWLPAVLRGIGLDVVELDGWLARGKDVMNPKVVIAHHTATRATSIQTGLPVKDGVVDYLLINGRVDLPGPLAHIHLTRSGQCRLIAGGMANHAGKGTWKGYSGNAVAIGIEAANDGLGEPWPQAQLNAYDLASAAMLRHLQLDSTYLAAHREWALPLGRKIDPTGIDMHAMRTRVQQLVQRKDDTMIIRQGAKGFHIVVWQRALNTVIVKNGLGLAPLVLDGVYGAKVTEAVKAYQTSAQLIGVTPSVVPEAGALDDYTRDLLAEYTREDG